MLTYECIIVPVKIRNKKYTKKIIIASILLALLAGSGAYLFIVNKNSSNNLTDTSEFIDKPISNGIDYSGPTDEEKAEEATQAQRDKEREELDKKPTATNASITVTEAAQYDDTIEVRAYISNLYESGGTCTATFTKSGQPSVTFTNQAMTDAKTIQCGALDIARSEFPQSGVWKLIVSYKSDNATGTTNAQDVTIR